MNRRGFLGVLGAAATGQYSAKAGPTHKSQTSQTRLAGMSLTELRRFYQRELFDIFLPFWDKYGIDHEQGGFLCNLDYDGTLANSEKFVRFQGRGIWVYSFLYNHFGKNRRHLEIARKTKDFLLKHAPLEDGRWATWLTRDGIPVGPATDFHAIFFGAEGLQEYASAAQDENALQSALHLLKMVFRNIGRPDFQIDGLTAPGLRDQSVWMKGLRVATKILRRWNDPEVSAIAERCVDAIIHRHYNPDIGLNNEVLNFDFSRPKEHANKCLIGVAIEALSTVMDEADRRNDRRLWGVAADRVRRHLEVGWDWAFGGLAEWVNVDQGCYEWPPEHPTGTDLEIRATGEYFYLKSLWALNEALIATLDVFERRGDTWAADFFGMMHRLVEEKYSQRRRGLPGYMLFGDRRLTFQPHVRRQDNYHPPHQMMLNLLTLDRMLAGT